MRFSAFIQGNLDSIIDEWERFARTLLPSASAMSARALRDHCRQILVAVALDMETRESDAERATKSKGMAPAAAGPETAATVHGSLRHLSGFDLTQLVAEFRAMRASVLSLWERSEGAATGLTAIEEVHRFNEAIDQALAESVESYSSAVAKSRDMFLAVLGHDLRSPLAAITMSNAALLVPGPAAEAGRQQAAMRIKRAAASMNELITDLLDYTRARLGSGIPIDKAPCDLGAICAQALDALRASHPDRLFVQHLSGDLRLDADAARIHQALSNLLGNAVQHGDPSAPVSLSAAGDDAAVTLRVANTGVPIPASALPAIFEPLVQAPREGAAADERSKTSLGLGLFIVREIALGHDGEVSVESSAEMGTAFTLRLPRAQG